jgi:hypothetical protein
MTASMPVARCRIANLTTTQRTRTLPAPGQVLRRVGDRVAADSPVAETDAPSGYRLVDLDKALGTHVPDMAKVLLKRVGDHVAKGEVLARTGRLAKAEYLAPVDGQIVDARGNKVLIEVAAEHIALTAFYPGQVVGLIPERGVRIDVTGALVQGAWAHGSEVWATLDCGAPDGDTPLLADQVTAVRIGTILVGGRSVDREVLALAVQAQVRAIVVGSISSDMLPVLDDSPISVLVTEGFGDWPMNSQTFQLLQSCAGREACFSPMLRTQWEARRAEVLIPLPAEGRSRQEEPSPSLAVGSRVRALRAPHENVLGIVIAMPKQPQRLESDIRARGAEVNLDGIGKVFIPFENLELIA